MEFLTISLSRLQQFDKKKLHVNDSKPLEETAFFFSNLSRRKKCFNPSSARDNSITVTARRI